MMDAESTVLDLCRKIGFGRVLQLASRLWQQQERETGIGMVVGPHVSCTVPCWHPKDNDTVHCDWCCGCGWVTEKVASVMPACTKCVDANAERCMEKRTKPGHYSDEAWLDEGAPDRCVCNCHKGKTHGNES